MKKVLLATLFPVLALATPLATLLEKVENAPLAQSQNYQIDAQKAQLNALKRAYLPKIEADGVYRYISESERSLLDFQTTLNVSASYVLFNGFNATHSIEAQNNQLKATQAQATYVKESLKLQVVTLFLNLDSLQALIETNRQKIIQLKDEKNRLERLYEAQTVQEDALESIKAALAMSEFDLQVQEQQYTEQAMSLQTLTGIKIDATTPVQFHEPDALAPVLTHNLKAQSYQIEAIDQMAAAKSSANWPTLLVKDTYNQTDYYGSISGFDMPTSSNKVELIASMTLVDFGAKSQEEQKLILEKKAMQSDFEHQKSALAFQQELLKTKLKTSKSQIRSAMQNLKANEKTYEFRQKSFKANLIDSSTYLESLTLYTQAKALYTKSLNDYQITLATYYFYHNIPLKEQLQ